MHDAIDKFEPYTTSDAPKAIDDCGLGADLAAHMRANPPDICDGNGDLPIGVPFYEKPFVAGLVNACSTVVALRRHLAWNYRGQPPVVYVGCDTGTATAMAMATGVACVRDNDGNPTDPWPFVKEQLVAAGVDADDDNGVIKDRQTVLPPILAKLSFVVKSFDVDGNKLFGDTTPSFVSESGRQAGRIRSRLILFLRAKFDFFLFV